jgi:hypothetical protein
MSSMNLDRMTVPSGLLPAPSVAEWERFVVRDARGRPAWYQWTDWALCEAWIARAVELTSAAREDVLDTRRSYDEQLAAVREAWAAIENVYRAIDLRPQIDPRYRQIFSRWYGSTTPIDPTATDSFNPARGDIGPSYVLGGEIRRRILSKWSELRKAPIDDRNTLCNIVARFLLSHRAAVIEQCAGRFGGGDGFCSFVGPFTGSVQDSKNRENDGSLYDWRTLAWHDPPALWGAGDSVCRVAKALPPLRWFFEIAREIAEAMRARGAQGIVEESRTFQVVQNLRQAQLLFPDRLGTVSELLEMSVRLPADVASAAINNPGLKATASVIAAAAAIAAQINPVAGVVLGILAAIYSVLPGAVAVELDEFGRGKPVFEAVFIGNDTRESIEPESRVVAPPGFTRGPRAVGRSSIMPTLSPIALRSLPRPTAADAVARIAPQLAIAPPSDLLSTSPTLTVAGNAAGAPAPGISTPAKVAIGLGLAAIAYAALR